MPAVYQYMVVKTVDDKGTRELVTESPVYVFAKDEQTVRMIAAQELPKGVDLNQIEVLVKPF